MVCESWDSFTGDQIHFLAGGQGLLLFISSSHCGPDRDAGWGHPARIEAAI